MPVALKETWAETDTDVELGVTETLAKVAEPPVPPVPVDAVLPPQAARNKKSEMSNQVALVRRTVILRLLSRLFQLQRL